MKKVAQQQQQAAQAQAPLAFQEFYKNYIDGEKGEGPRLIDLKGREVTVPPALAFAMADFLRYTWLEGTSHFFNWFGAFAGMAQETAAVMGEAEQNFPQEAAVLEAIVGLRQEMGTMVA